jgi:hypothetical protein
MKLTFHVCCQVPSEGEPSGEVIKGYMEKLKAHLEAGGYELATFNFFSHERMFYESLQSERHNWITPEESINIHAAQVRLRQDGWSGWPSYQQEKENRIKESLLFRETYGDIEKPPPQSLEEIIKGQNDV